MTDFMTRALPGTAVVCDGRCAVRQEEGGQMEVKVLGPLEAYENGRSVTPSASKPRQILALLALQANQVVTVPSLIEELWGMNSPRSALTTLQTYILQLRRLIDAAPAGGPAQPATGQPGTKSRGAKDVLVTLHGGYRLSVAPGAVDVQTYERLATAGREAAELGDYESASSRLRAAMDLWRGQVLVDVPLGPSLAIEVARLEESRLGVLEARIDADLRLGRHLTLLSELAVLTGRYGMHENLYAQYMIALYRAGRRWRALEVFTALRTTLVDQLGVEPSKRLQDLQQAILNSDPSLDDPVSHDLRQRQLVG